MEQRDAGSRWHRALAIGVYAREQAASHPTLMTDLAGGDLEQIDSAIVAEAARRGDSLAAEIVDRAADYIAIGLVNLIVLFLPDGMVLTGGVMRSFDLMETRIRSVISRHNIMSPVDKVALRLASLGQQAGTIGVARAAMLVGEE